MSSLQHSLSFDDTRRIQAQIASIPEPVVVVGKDGLVLSMNSQAYIKMGMRAWVLGMPVDVFLQGGLIEDKDVFLIAPEVQ